MDMSHQEIYFRSLIVIFGLSIAVGAFVIEAVILLKLLEITGGIVLIIISTIKRFKLWP